MLVPRIFLQKKIEPVELFLQFSYRPFLRKPQSPGVEIRIAPAENHVQYGEVLAKGPNVFSSYRHLPEKTRELFTADGYFRTGDVGYVDDDGYLRLVGRIADMIVLPGGENIRPEASENMLARGAHIREAGILAFFLKCTRFAEMRRNEGNKLQK